MKKQSKTRNKTAKIRAMLDAGKSVKEIAAKLQVKPSAVYQVRWRVAKEVKANEGPVTAPVQGKKEPEQDLVNHPAHYMAGGIETIDYIEAWNFPYHLANVIKYVSRAAHKGKYLQDLKKAEWYLKRAIKNEEGR